MNTEYGPISRRLRTPASMRRVRWGSVISPPMERRGLDGRATAFSRSSLGRESYAATPYLDLPQAERLAPRVGAPSGREARRILVKRILDVCVALPAIVLFAPILIFLWLLVRATSRGPGLFWSVRVGRNGRLFRMPKFRTMQISAPLMPRESLDEAKNYVTPVGRCLRKTSFDELPQLWCVLIGQMSFIGPRPLIPSDPAAKARWTAFSDSLSVPPGISGLAQTNGRNHVRPRNKARYDAFYARKFSLGLDCLLLVRTIEIVVSKNGGGVL